MTVMMYGGRTSGVKVRRRQRRLHKAGTGRGIGEIVELHRIIRVSEPLVKSQL